MEEPRTEVPTVAAEPVEQEVPADYHTSSLWHWSGVPSVIGGGLFALLGLLLVAGALAYNRQDVLENARPSDLVQILDSLDAENDRLDAEKRRLENELESLGSGTSAEALDQARARLADLEVLAGTTPVRGPGVRLVIRDPEGNVSAADIIDAVQELRDAGAESIEVADRRVVVNTWFGDVPEDQKPGILVSGDLRRSPYVIRAIGDPQTLATAMEIPGGVADTVRATGARFTSERRDTLEITSTVPLATPEYAKPAQTE